jgi:hypothetical protein
MTLVLKIYFRQFSMRLKSIFVPLKKITAYPCPSIQTCYIKGVPLTVKKRAYSGVICGNYSAPFAPAIAWPNRWKTGFPRLDLSEGKHLALGQTNLREDIQ